MNAYGTPMPQAVPLPPATPIPGAPPAGAYGPPPAQAMPPAPSPQMAAPAPVAAAPAPYGAPAAPGGIGPNGFGIHPDLNLDHVTAFLMNALKTHESAGNYDAKNPHSTASGGYQVTNGTWNNFGGYPRAVDAPPEVQDAWAKQNISSNLKRYGGDPFKATVAHYYPAWAGSPEKWDSAPIDKTGRPIPGAETPAQYASKVLPPEHVERYMSSVRGNPGA